MSPSDSGEFRFSISDEYLQEYLKQVNVSRIASSCCLVASVVFAALGLLLRNGTLLGWSAVAVCFFLYGRIWINSARKMIEWARANPIEVHADQITIGGTSIKRSAIRLVRLMGITAGLPGILLIRAKDDRGRRIRYHVPIRLYRRRELLYHSLLSTPRSPSN
jgi:hypothetical protein